MYLFRLLRLGFATGNHLPTSHPIPAILVCPTDRLHVLLHDIHEYSMWFSSLPSAWQLYIQHPLSFLCTYPNHFIFASLTCLSPNSPSWPVPLMYPFLIPSILVILAETCNIFSSATTSLASRLFVCAKPSQDVSLSSGKAYRSTAGVWQHIGSRCVVFGVFVSKIWLDICLHLSNAGCTVLHLLCMVCYMFSTSLLHSFFL